MYDTGEGLNQWYLFFKKLQFKTMFPLRCEYMSDYAVCV